MAEYTSIEWATHTLNWWTGCEEISPGCYGCYAHSWAKRAGRVFNERRLTTDANRRQPLKWDAAADSFEAQHGHRQRVFTNSLGDVFDNKVPQQWRDGLFALIKATPRLDWLLLTKRIGNAAKMLPKDWGDGYQNVWLGATVVNQEEADRDIPKLLNTPATIRFLSCEPLLGEIDLSCIPYPRGSRDHIVDENADGFDALRYASGPHLDWVIVGGESGPQARAMHPDWVRLLRDQCAAARVPFFFKQWGEWRPICEGAADWYEKLYRSNRRAKKCEDQSALDSCYGRHCTVEQLCLHIDGGHVPINSPTAFLVGTQPIHAFRVGKKAAGRELDGREWNAFPMLLGDERAALN